MDTKFKIQKEGWVRASKRIKKFHYYVDGVSLCGKHKYQGWLTQSISEDFVRCCNVCLDKLRERRANSLDYEQLLCQKVISKLSTIISISRELVTDMINLKEFKKGG